MSNRLLIADSYKSLREILNERRRQLKLSMLDLDEKAGLSEGYSGHILGGSRNFGGTALELLLGALGVQIALVEIPKDGKTYRIRAIKKDHLLKHRMS